MGFDVMVCCNCKVSFLDYNPYRQCGYCINEICCECMAKCRIQPHVYACTKCKDDLITKSQQAKIIQVLLNDSNSKWKSVEEVRQHLRNSKIIEAPMKNRKIDEDCISDGEGENDEDQESEMSVD